jgi:hypothetical protein
MDQQGTCGDGEVCCIDTDQCVDAMGFTCAVTADDCTGTPPPPGFPMIGCPAATPYCCVVMGGGK